MHTDYLSPAIRQLRDQQVRFAPYEKQIAQETGRSEETVRYTPRHFTRVVSASETTVAPLYRRAFATPSGEREPAQLVQASR